MTRLWPFWFPWVWRISEGWRSHEGSPSCFSTPSYREPFCRSSSQASWILSSPGNLYLNLTRRVSVLKKTTLKPRTKLHGVHNIKSSESKYLNIDPFLFRIQLQPKWSWWMWVWLAIQEEHVQHVTITITVIIIIIRHVTIIRKNMSNMSRWHGVIRKHPRSQINSLSLWRKLVFQWIFSS